jgi:hypothetical protein
MSYYNTNGFQNANQICGPNGCPVPIGTTQPFWNYQPTQTYATPCVSSTGCPLPSWYVSQPTTSGKVTHLKGDEYLCAINPSGTTYNP